MASPKLPAFSGRCRVQQLSAHAALAATVARLLCPVPLPAAPLAALPVGITARTGNRAPYALLALLLAYAVGCTPARKTAATVRHREEHAAPAVNPHGYSYDDTDH